MLKHFLSFGRVVVTAMVVIMALIALRFLWDRYELDPWTRDGRVRAEVVFRLKDRGDEPYDLLYWRDDFDGPMQPA